MYYPDMQEMAVNELAQRYAAETGDESVLEPYKNIFYIGWLDPPTKEPTIGETPKVFKSKIDKICKSRKFVYEMFLGHHDCPMCGKVRSSQTILIKDLNSAMKFYFPDMVAHYVIVHDYKPPQEFIDAIMAFDLSAPVPDPYLGAKSMSESFDPKNIANLMEDDLDASSMHSYRIPLSETLSIIKDFLDDKGYLVKSEKYAGYLIVSKEPSKYWLVKIYDRPKIMVYSYNLFKSETLDIYSPTFFNALIMAVDEMAKYQQTLCDIDD